MGDLLRGSGNLGDGNVVQLTGKIMVVAIIILLFVVVFVFCLHLYAKWFWYRRNENARNTTGRRRGRQDRTVVAALRPGLDPSVLKTIPVVVFNTEQFKDGLECAVCLCEVSEGEKARLLPKCNHGFHVECIDMWFQSHSTCPLCRNPVADPSSNPDVETTLEDILHPVGESSAEAPSFPTNVLFWGDETRISTVGPCVEENHQGGESSSSSSSSSAAVTETSTSNRPDGALVIDIPRQANEEEEQKSPIPSRLRSLKRLLSGNRRMNPFSPRSSDIEQGDQSQT